MTRLRRDPGKRPRQRAGDTGGQTADRATDTTAAANYRCGFVTLFGRSNVGKSTLLNRLVGEKVAIVTDVPQTTRNRLQGVRTFPDAQAIYMDTPGMHRPRFALNRRMVAAALGALDGMDLLLLLIDGAAGLGPGDRYVMRLAASRAEPVFLIINKTDLMAKPALLPLIASLNRDHSFAEIIPLSAASGDNVDRLETLIRASLPVRARLFPPDELTDVPERFLLAELLREQIILHTREELPHSSAVMVERFEETAGGIVEIDMLVLVERDSQKGIVIGKRGEMMKNVASAARVEMEALLGTKVFLQTWVKVAPRWRMDARLLDQLGVERGRSGVTDE